MSLPEWFSASSALIGAFIGASGGIAAQALTQRGTTRREREARDHELHAKRYEIERDTLLATQDALITHMKFTVKRAYLPRSATPEEIKDAKSAQVDANRTVKALSARLLDRTAAEAVNEYLDAVDKIWADPYNESVVRPVNDGYNRAQRLIGEAFRKPISFEQPPRRRQLLRRNSP